MSKILIIELWKSISMEIWLACDFTSPRKIQFYTDSFSIAFHGRLEKSHMVSDCYEHQIYHESTYDWIVSLSGYGIENEMKLVSSIQSSSSSSSSGNLWWH